MEGALPGKVYCFDLDGTLCLTVGTDYASSKPIESRIDTVNDLFDKGSEIIIFTARGSMTGADHRKLTESQLRSWGVKYHHLQFGKPAADVYIDDKAMKDSNFFSN